MKSEKALELGKFLDWAVDIFMDVFEHEDTEIANFDKLKADLNDSAFEACYRGFMDELQGNITKFRDVQLANDYISACLMKFKRGNLFQEGFNRYIIAKNHEVSFLLNLKKNIEYYSGVIRELLGTNDVEPSDKLKTVYAQLLSQAPVSEGTHFEKDEPSTPEKAKEADEPLIDERFDFDTLKKTCDLIPDELDRMNYIYNVTVDFRQWQLQYDYHVTNFGTGPYYFYTEKYYPHFLELCEMEMERYLKILARKKTLSSEHHTTQESPEEKEIPIELSRYVWKGNDTDFLELMASIHQEKIIQRRDRKNMSRIELIEFFMATVGLKINNIEEKLYKATNRMDKTPMLDRLTTGFENLCDEKEEKLRKMR